MPSEAYGSSIDGYVQSFCGITQLTYSWHFLLQVLSRAEKLKPAPHTTAFIFQYLWAIITSYYHHLFFLCVFVGLFLQKIIFCYFCDILGRS